MHLKKVYYLSSIVFAFGVIKSSSSNQSNNLPTFNSLNDCKNVILKAEARTNYATSPGFPKPFPGDSSCKWAIYSQPGKRIRLEFQKFHLLEAVDGTCFYQYVTVTTPFSPYSMGPYCGLQGLPTIISTGNLIYIELVTPSPVTTDNYQGFKIAFKETLESSSYELRPDDYEDDVIMTVDPPTMNILSPTTPTMLVTTPRSSRSTTKSSRFNPARRPVGPLNRRPIRPTSPPTRRTIVRNRPPMNRAPSPPRDYSSVNRRLNPGSNRVLLPPEESKPELKLEIIIAVAVAVVVLLALLVFVGLKVKQSTRRKEDKESPDNREQISQFENTEKSNAIPMCYVYPQDVENNYAQYYSLNGRCYEAESGNPKKERDSIPRDKSTGKEKSRRRERDRKDHRREKRKRDTSRTKRNYK